MLYDSDAAGTDDEEDNTVEHRTLIRMEVWQGGREIEASEPPITGQQKQEHQDAQQGEANLHFSVP
jgi:hypothetical protein